MLDGDNKEMGCLLNLINCGGHIINNGLPMTARIAGYIIGIPI